MHLDGLAPTDVERQPVNGALPVAGWCHEARQDPITGLVAFPDFNYFMPDILASCRSQGFDLGIAIGDVDNLKEYVENSKSIDASAYGHMAGCALMQSLGVSAAGWFDRVGPTFGCLSTFGGDEIIVVLAIEPGAEESFEAEIAKLRDELFEALPRSVSFGWTVARMRDEVTAPLDRPYLRSRSVDLLSSVDQALFRQKSALRNAGLRCEGFITKASIT